MRVCVRDSGMFAGLATLLNGADREGERDVFRLWGFRRRFTVLASVVETVELPQDAPRRALRRDVFRERARRTLSRKSTGAMSALLPSTRMRPQGEDDVGEAGRRTHLRRSTALQ